MLILSGIRHLKRRKTKCILFDHIDQIVERKLIEGCRRRNSNKNKRIKIDLFCIDWKILLLVEPVCWAGFSNPTWNTLRKVNKKYVFTSDVDPDV